MGPDGGVLPPCSSPLQPLPVALGMQRPHPQFHPMGWRCEATCAPTPRSQGSPLPTAPSGPHKHSANNMEKQQERREGRAGGALWPRWIHPSPSTPSAQDVSTPAGIRAGILPPASAGAGLVPGSCCCTWLEARMRPSGLPGPPRTEPAEPHHLQVGLIWPLPSADTQLRLMRTDRHRDVGSGSLIPWLTVGKARSSSP